MKKIIKIITTSLVLISSFVFINIQSILTKAVSYDDEYLHLTADIPTNIFISGIDGQAGTGTGGMNNGHVLFIYDENLVSTSFQSFDLYPILDRVIGFEAKEDSSMQYLTLLDLIVETTTEPNDISFLLTNDNKNLIFRNAFTNIKLVRGTSELNVDISNWGSPTNARIFNLTNWYAYKYQKTLDETKINWAGQNFDATVIGTYTQWSYFDRTYDTYKNTQPYYNQLIEDAYNEARSEFGIYINGNWLTAEEYAIIVADGLQEQIDDLQQQLDEFEYGSTDYFLFEFGTWITPVIAIVIFGGGLFMFITKKREV